MIGFIALTAMADDTGQKKEEVVVKVIETQGQTEQKLDLLLQALAQRSDEDAEVICDSGVLDCDDFVGPQLPSEVPEDPLEPAPPEQPKEPPKVALQEEEQPK